MELELYGIVAIVLAVFLSSQQGRRSGLNSSSFALLLIGAFFVFYGASISDDFFGLPADIGTVASYVTVVGGTVGVLTYYIRAQMQNLHNEITNLGLTLRGDFNTALGQIRTDVAVLNERTKNLKV
ncbi:MAG TPA: hypothetical protein VKF15_01435 [Nitrososphaerales archaeon]|nr:hypothetical protein [Nitrososphaerales archaeon]